MSCEELLVSLQFLLGIGIMNATHRQRILCQIATCLELCAKELMAELANCQVEDIAVQQIQIKHTYFKRVELLIFCRDDKTINAISINSSGLLSLLSSDPN